MTQSQPELVFSSFLVIKLFSFRKSVWHRRTAENNLCHVLDLWLCFYHPTQLPMFNELVAASLNQSLYILSSVGACT